MAQPHSFTKDLSDWADGKRERLGEPPTAEQLLALRDGKLPEEEADRLRERLAVDPEWAEIYLELKRGTDDAADAAPTLDSSADVDGAWNRLAAELDLGRVVPFRRRGSSRVLLALAAVLILGLGVAFFWGWPAASGKYMDVAITGETYRAPRKIPVPKDVVGLAFFINASRLGTDASTLTGTVEIQLFNATGQVIQNEQFQIHPTDPEITFRVALRSISADGVYRLGIRLSGSSPTAPARILESFTLVFED